MQNPSAFSRVAFKVKSNSPKGKVIVNPAVGVIEPRQSIEVLVALPPPSASYQRRSAVLGAARENAIAVAMSSRRARAATADNGVRLMVQTLLVTKVAADLKDIWANVPWR